MRQETKVKIDKLILAIYNELKESKAGIVDGARIASQVINYFIEKGIINKSERNESCEYVCELFNAAYHYSMPQQHIQVILSEMLKVENYEYSIVNKIRSNM